MRCSIKDGEWGKDTRFLWLPKKLGERWRWLTFADIYQRYSAKEGRWMDVDWWEGGL